MPHVFIGGKSVRHSLTTENLGPGAQDSAMARSEASWMETQADGILQA